MSEPQPKLVSGVYLLPEYRGELLLTSLPAEDLESRGKQELDLNRSKIMQILLSTMYSFVSGGVEEGFSPRQQIAAETAQELGLTIAESRFEDLNLPPTYTLQSRNGKGLFLIEGQGFKLELTEQELKQAKLFLKEEKRLFLLSTWMGLMDLIKNNRIQLRPFALSVLKIFESDLTYV